MIIYFLSIISVLALALFFRRSKNKKLYERALVIGKFYPPHKGHQLLIQTALEKTKSLVVIICKRPKEMPSGELRLSFIKQIFDKNANLKATLLIEDNYDQDDSELWARLCIEWLKPIFPDKNPPIQAVFTSEKYGDPFCFYLSKKLGSEIKHHLVDLHRLEVPISGTKIRNTPYAYLNYLDPVVRNYYITRIIFKGFELGYSKKYAKKLKSVCVDDLKKNGNISLWLNQLLKAGFKTNRFVISGEVGFLESDHTNNFIKEMNEFSNKIHFILIVIKNGHMFDKVTTQNLRDLGINLINVNGDGDEDEVISKFLKERC